MHKIGYAAMYGSAAGADCGCGLLLLVQMGCNHSMGRPRGRGDLGHLACWDLQPIVAAVDRIFEFHQFSFPTTLLGAHHGIDAAPTVRNNKATNTIVARPEGQMHHGLLIQLVTCGTLWEGINIKD